MIDVTINPPDQILVEALSENSYNIIVTAQSAIQVSVSPQSGLQGLKGDQGISVPAGGYAGQALKKLGDGDYDFYWVTDDIPAGLNKEVQFNDNGKVGSEANFLYDKDKKALSVGKPTILPNAAIAVGGDIDGYVQVTVQNKNDGIDASSDFVATADDGDDESHYIDIGINNSNYADPDFNITNADDGYLFVQDGDLIIGSTKDNVKTFIGDTTSGSIIHTVSSTGLNMASGKKVQENGFNLSDLIIECDSATAETIAFASGSKIVIRTDLI